MRIPNTAVDVVVGVSASGKDVPDLQRRLANKSNTLLTYLKAQQVERLITVNVSFSPETRYDKSGPDKTVGYDGTTRIAFRTTPDKVADILGGVLANGANEIDSTIFTPTEQEIADARRHLSEEATRIAGSEADAIAKAAGMKVVSLRNINVNDSGFARTSSVQYEDNLAGFAAAKTRAPQPMQAASGDDQLSVQVNIVAAATR